MLTFIGISLWPLRTHISKGIYCTYICTRTHYTWYKLVMLAVQRVLTRPTTVVFLTNARGPRLLSCLRHHLWPDKLSSFKLCFLNADYSDLIGFFKNPPSPSLFSMAYPLPYLRPPYTHSVLFFLFLPKFLSRNNFNTIFCDSFSLS